MLRKRTWAKRSHKQGLTHTPMGQATRFLSQVICLAQGVTIACADRVARRNWPGCELCDARPVGARARSDIPEFALMPDGPTKGDHPTTTDDSLRKLRWCFQPPPANELQSCQDWVSLMSGRSPPRWAINRDRKPRVDPRCRFSKQSRNDNICFTSFGISLWARAAPRVGCAAEVPTLMPAPPQPSAYGARLARVARCGPSSARPSRAHERCRRSPARCSRRR